MYDKKDPFCELHYEFRIDRSYFKKASTRSTNLTTEYTAAQKLIRNASLT